MIKYTLFVLLAINFSMAAPSHHKNMVMEKNSKMRIQLSSKVERELKDVLNSNEELLEAISHFDLQKIKLNAKRLSKRISNISDKKIAKLLNFSQSKLLELDEMSDKEKIMQNFNSFSMALIHILKEYEISDHNAFYCPMQKKKWVQNVSDSKTPRNPYNGEMRDCGDMVTNF